MDEFNDRRDKELPGTTAMFQGIALKCDKCGKKALLQEQGGETILSSPPTNKR